MKDCESCKFFIDSNCTKGQDASNYCLSGDHELWEMIGSPDKPKAPTPQQTNGGGLALEVPDEIMEAEARFQEELRKQYDALTDEEKALVDADKEAMEQAATNEAFDLKPPPNFEGFNGIQKPAVPTQVSNTCIGCKNHSPMLGCFINVFKECTANGRYLYQNDQNAQPVSAGLEGEEDASIENKAMKEVDDILDSSFKPTPKKKMEDADIDKFMDDLL